MKPAPPVTSTRGIRSVTGPLDDRHRGAEQDDQVIPEGPRIDVLQVETSPVGEIGDKLPAVDLPSTRQTRLHAQLPHLPELEVLVFRREYGTRTDQAHVPGQDAPELGQLVDAVLSEPAPQRRNSGISHDLEDWSAALIKVEQVGLENVGISYHGPELEAHERAAVPSQHPPPVESRTLRGQLDGDAGDQQKGEENNEQRGG